MSGEPPIVEPHCPTCAVPMAVGFTFTGIDSYFPGQPGTWLHWAEGEPTFGIFGPPLSDKVVYAARAFRCPKCGLIQFYATKREY